MSDTSDVNHLKYHTMMLYLKLMLWQQGMERSLQFNELVL